MHNLYERFKNWLHIEQHDVPVVRDQVNNVEQWRLDAEDLEALHANLDREGVPRFAGSNEDQEEYSAWGRVLRYAQMVKEQNK